MDDIQKLLEQLSELDDQIINCMKCGMCQAVCPVFSQTGNEADVTRGKLALIDALSAQILDNPDHVQETLNRCLMCGTCQANCPSGVDVVEIFFRARGVMTGYYGLSSIKKIIFKGMLANPGFFDGLVSISAKFQNLFIKGVDEKLGSSCARFNLPVVDDRHFNALAKKPLRKIVSGVDTPAGNSGLRIGFYPGCVVDKMYTNIGLASLKVFEHYGVGVYMPKGQACCGIPVLSSGDKRTFNKLVELNVQKFGAADFDYLVTPCASCTATIKELWPLMYTGNREISETLKVLGDKCLDINQFLVEHLEITVPDETNGNTVTYHDPCHLKNSLKVTRQPRDLLKASGIQFVEMNDSGTCCGCGGTFNVYHYDMSKEIGNKKADNIIDSGADLVATSCPACMMQMTDMLSRRNRGIGVKHVVELYADSL
ncbi:MAG: (Fe-S)-binding protein [Desulfobulbaceae bacterium]|nr:MAG: (Fe-S)-binding protein [Desulfobulbaceae bacterium]